MYIVTGVGFQQMLVKESTKYDAAKT